MQSFRMLASGAKFYNVWLEGNSGLFQNNDRPADVLITCIAEMMQGVVAGWSIAPNIRTNWELALEYQFSPLIFSVH